MTKKQTFEVDMARLEELVTTLEGLSSSQVKQALSNFRQNFVEGLFGQLASLADLAGKGELAEELRAKALAISTRMQILSIRMTPILTRGTPTQISTRSRTTPNGFWVPTRSPAIPTATAYPTVAKCFSIGPIRSIHRVLSSTTIPTVTG